MAILRQQVDSLTANKESLLTAYNQEQAKVTSLEQQIERMREANKVSYMYTLSYRWYISWGKNFANFVFLKKLYTENKKFIWFTPYF